MSSYFCKFYKNIKTVGGLEWEDCGALSGDHRKGCGSRPKGCQGRYCSGGSILNQEGGLTNRN